MVPASWLTLSELRHLMGEFSEVFPHAWTFLAPEGSDQLILAGWGEEPSLSWETLDFQWKRAASDLARHGIQSPLDLADRNQYRR